MRFLSLYLRARRVPFALTLAALSVAALGWLGDATLAVAAATMAAGPGLAGADPDLERTAAISWPPRRAAHVIAIAAVLALLAIAIPGGQTLRNAVGMTGLLALGATLLGASRAWILPLTWTALAWAVTIWNPHQEVLSWMFQPVQSTAATVTAAVLGVTGALAYTRVGARRR